MKKKSACLLISDILLTFFLITVSSYLVFAIYSLKEKTELTGNFAETLMNDHFTLLFVFAGTLILFLAFVAGWVAYVMNKKNVIKASAIILSVGEVVLALGTAMAFIGNPAYSFASLLFALFFVPSAALSWLAALKK